MAKSILIADDNPEIRKLLCHLFEAQHDYDLCAQAATGQEAIDLALLHHPDLVILDLSMPVMDGLVAARELKKLLPKILVILFTAYADLGKQLLAANKSLDRVVSKTETNELMTQVRSLIPN